jgi:hypothetical protein
VPQAYVLSASELKINTAMEFLGELLVYVIYGGIISFGILLGYQACVLKRTFARVLFAFGSLICFAFAGYTYISDKNYTRAMELQHAGTYRLTNYPNCSPCKAVLNEDNTYKVVSEDSVFEKGDWHFEMGDDYLIVFVNGKNDQMGGGRFEYDTFMDKHGKVY